jgi:hypothetical protein
MSSLVKPSAAIRTGPPLCGRRLASIDPADFAQLQAAFSAAPSVTLQQTWQVPPSANFAPATVRVAWQGDSLLVFAELTDAEIVSGSTRHNQRLWELGDSFEMFFRPEHQEAYLELQVSPNNHRLQLRYANPEALERARITGSIQEALIHGAAFRSYVWLEAQKSRWFVLAEVPTPLVQAAGAAQPGDGWRYSFSRYDYTKSESEPVISSTSPHAEANFHRQQEWGRLEFTD